MSIESEHTNDFPPDEEQAKGNPSIDLDDEIIKETEAAARAEQEEYSPGYRAPLTQPETEVCQWLTEPPKPPRSLVTFKGEPFLVHGVVGSLVATGGTGKSFFIMTLAARMAEGRNFGPLEIPKPLRVFVLFAEDSQDEVARRLYNVCEGRFPQGLFVTSSCGVGGPITCLDEHGNPTVTAEYEWLRRTIKNLGPIDILFLDPKSRLDGLDENKNEYGTHFIKTLESIAKEFGISVMFTHHTSKSMANEKSQHSSRGAISVSDGCRWVANLLNANEKDANKFSIENPRDYIKFDVTKTNCTARPPGEIFFKRGKNGTLGWADLCTDRFQAMAGYLADQISKCEEPVTKRDFAKRAGPGPKIAKAIKSEFPGFTPSREIELLIDYAIKRGMLKLEDAGQEGGNLSRRPALVAA